MRYPWANTTLLVLLALQLATGFGGLISGSEQLSWVLWCHSVGGYALAILLFYKGAIIGNVLQRRWVWSLPRLAFIGLTAMLIAILATGWIWSFMGSSQFLGFSLLVLHGLLGGGLIGLLIWHSGAKWYVWRLPAARDRRAFLRLAGLTLAGVTARLLVEPAKAVATLPGAQRRFTGSYETGSYTGNFPVTSWLSDQPPPVDGRAWRLVIDGAVEHPLRLTYRDLAQLAGVNKTALLDCTGGFYTSQDWTGVPFSDLLRLVGLKPTARSVTVEAVSGYSRRFSLAVTERFLLATAVAGQPLSHGHGFPVRLVAPGYRGFAWVKWVSHIRVNETSHWWQPPVPLK